LYNIPDALSGAGLLGRKREKTGMNWKSFITFSMMLLIGGLASSIMAQDITPPADSTAHPQDSIIYNPLDRIKTAMAAVDSARKSYGRFSFDDSVTAFFLVERMNLNNEVNRSFTHDAGDYLRSCPSNLIIEDFQIPSRKTVAPFALPGNRMNVIFNNHALHPLSHYPEPDNQIDFNDIPTAAVGDVYNIEGPLGLALDGSEAISSLIMIPHSPDSTLPESKMVVDKGSNGYANTKGSFAADWKNGVKFRGAAEYRKVTEIKYPGDDSYQYWGNLFYPYSSRLDIDLSGRIYRRAGTYLYRPDFYASRINRFRRDRDMTAEMTWRHSDLSRSSLEFRHQRSESRGEVSWGYSRNLDIINNEFGYSYENKIRFGLLKTEVSFSREEFTDGAHKTKRLDGSIESRFLTGNRREAFLALARLDKAEGYKISPGGAVIYTRNGDRFYLSSSIGYSRKSPRQYETELKYKLSNLLGSSNADYAESGNPSLLPEKQLVGNFTLGLGEIGSDLILSLTGGKIYDGIDWRFESVVINGANVNSFMTFNNDITFASATAKKRIHFKKSLSCTLGASYHYLKINDNTDPPYSPDYQLFGGMELYHYISALDVHLYGYLETIYNGPYFGNLIGNMGEQPILNLKLSFRIKKFRFDYIFQDLSSIEYQSREDATIGGRYSYYGITWEFIN
jgi:hypothetical protein